MLTEDLDITLENLLNLALGTPEIGAVNFNFLHEVITEILKHLGISKKVARITQEVDFRLADPEASLYNRRSLIAPEPTHKYVSTESMHEVEQDTGITEPTGEATVELEYQVNQVNQAPEHVPSKHSVDKTSVGKIEPIKEEETVVLAETNDRRVSLVAPAPAKPLHTQRKSSFVHAHRSSFASGPRLSLKLTDSANQDVSIVNRTMERRDSKTPAGDMWHVLNINRRVEAAEAAIQGMTNLIDTVNSDLDDLKNNPPPISGVPQETSISKQEQEVVKKMAAKLKSYDGKFNDIDKKIGDLATKKEVQACCTSQQVKDLIEENFDNFQPIVELPTEPVASAPVKKESEPVASVPVKKESEPIASVPVKKESEPVASVPVKKESEPVASIPVKKESEPVLRKRESRDSRTRIAYQEVSNKMLFLEQEINKAKQRIDQLDLELAKKLELSSIEGKSEKIDVDEQISSLNVQIKSLTSHMQTLEKSYKSVVEDVNSLVTQNDEFTAKQKTLSSALRKLERNLEDMTDNFHRTQSDMMKGQQTNNTVDETVITKIRGTIFDIQDQQSKFQNQIDVIVQSGKNQDTMLDEMAEGIKMLQETKVDKDYVLKQLEGKADRNTVENKVSRDQFDICVGEIDRNIQDAMQKIEGTEASASKAICTLEQCINEKMDRNEMGNIKGYIDTRFKSFKPKVQELQKPEDSAAATRKQILPNCNCISCDRPIDIPTTHPGVTLPYYQPLPGMKSIRPMTTFDLQTIRQHMQQSWCHGNKERFETTQARDKLQKELLQLCGVRDLDELAEQTNRACGGVHTLIEQNRRNPGKPPMFYREEHVPFQSGERQLFETDVLGRDGHIYKGRMQTSTLPTIARKPIQNGITSETQPQQPPRAGSPIMARPSVQQSGSIINTGPVSIAPRLQTVE